MESTGEAVPFFFFTMFAGILDVTDTVVLAQTGQDFASTKGGGFTVPLGYALIFGAFFELGCMAISVYDLVQVFTHQKPIGPELLPAITIGNLVLLVVLLFAAVCPQPFCHHAPVPLGWVLVHFVSTVVTFVAGIIGSHYRSRPADVAVEVGPGKVTGVITQVIGAEGRC